MARIKDIDKRTPISHLTAKGMEEPVGTVRGLGYDPEGRVVDYGGKSLDAAIELTATEIDALIDESGLKTGQTYILLDFETRHRIPYSIDIHTGPTEKLLLTAVSPTAFSSTAYSISYPKHILEFDYTNRLCEDGLTSRNGLITERYDPVNNVRIGCDYLNVNYYRYPAQSKIYQPGTKVDDSNVTVTINANRPGLSNRLRYEVEFEAMTHPNAPVTITLQYNNGTWVKPIYYYLDQNIGASLPVDHLSGKKGTIIYNPTLDAFVFMSFIDIGSDFVGEYFIFTNATTYGLNYGAAGITFASDGVTRIKTPMFMSTYRDVHIRTNKSLIGTDSFYPNIVFKGTVLYGFHVGGYVKDATFLSSLNGPVRCGGDMTHFLTNVPHNMLLIEEFAFYSTLFNKVGGNWNYELHKFRLLERGMISVCQNMQMGDCKLMNIILNAGNNFNSTAATLSEGNIFASNLNVGSSIPGNFYITAPQYRSLVGYMDTRSLNISKTLNNETLFRRENLGPYNILGTTITADQTQVVAGPNDGSSAAKVQSFMIDPENSLYGMRLMNTQNVQAPDAEVQYFWEYDSNVGDGIKKTRPVFGVTRPAVFTTGTEKLPDALYAALVSLEGANKNVADYRVPLSHYNKGISQSSVGMIIGSEADQLSKITGDTKLYIEGGIKTAAPTGGSEAVIRIGSAIVNASNTVDRIVQLEIDGQVIYLLGRTTV